MDDSDGIGYSRDVADGPAFDFGGLRALVTGSTSGIGAAIADGLERSGALVVRHGLEPGPPSVLTHDLSAPDAGRELALAAMALGGVDILVHAASVQRRTDWTEISTAEFAGVVQTNLISTMELIQTVVPAMVSRGWGRVLDARQRAAAATTPSDGRVRRVEGRPSLARPQPRRGSSHPTESP